MKPVDLVKAALGKASCTTNGRGKWRCPAHQDRIPSLSVQEHADGLEVEVVVPDYRGQGPDGKDECHHQSPNGGITADQGIAVEERPDHQCAECKGAQRQQEDRPDDGFGNHL